MKQQLTTMTRKGQITVPAEIRKALGLQIGDRVLVSFDEQGEDRHANLRPIHSVADTTFGALGNQKRPVSGDLREAFIDHASERDERTKPA